MFRDRGRVSRVTGLCSYRAYLYCFNGCIICFGSTAEIEGARVRRCL